MITLTQPFFWFNFIYFFFVVFLAFFIPGNILIRAVKLDNLSKLVISTVVGFVLWGFIGYFSGYIAMRWIFYPYIIVTTSYWLYLNREKLTHRTFKKIKLKRDRWSVGIGLLILIGSISQILTIFPNGITIKEGIYFCCGGTDLFYHMALTNSLIHNFPPFAPGASGTIVKNYHYFSNLVIADVVRIFRLPPLETMFQYFGTLFSFGIGLSALSFAKTLRLHKSYAFWLIFFLYFSGDIIYVFLFLIGEGFKMHYVFLHDPTKLWMSPSRVFAIPVLFTGLTLLCYWLKDRNNKIAIISSIMFASLIAIKVYVGIFTFIGLSFLELYLLKSKKFYQMAPWLLAYVLALLLYMYVNIGAGGLIFVGTWRIENFIVQPIFNTSHLELAREVYVAAHSWLRVIEYESIFLFLYFAVLFGTLNLGFIQTKKSLALFPRELNIFLIPAVLISLFLGMFFIQKTGGANSGQFVITAIIFSSIYASLTVFYFISSKKGKVKYIFLILIVLLTAPRVLSETKSIVLGFSLKSGITISNKELEGLSFLKNNTPKDSLVMVDDNYLRKEYQVIDGKREEVPEPDLRNFAGLNSYYVPFFSQRSMFLDGGTAIDVFGVDIKERKEDQDIIFYSGNKTLISKILEKDKINYIYTIPKRAMNIPSSQNLKTVFNNGKIQIIKVER